VCEDDALGEVVDGIVDSLLQNAPLSMWAAKQAVTRLRRASLPDADDLVRRVYGSNDFRNGVRAFGAKERVVWTGR
jgi:enoyl-CoA hydratase/carnithine racemase